MPDEQDTKGGAFFSREVVGGVPWVLASKVIGLIINFGTSVLVVRLLGKHEFGIVGMCLTIGEYILVLCGLGLNSALVRFVPELTVNRNRAGIVRLFGRTALLQAGMLALAVVFLLLSKPVFDAHYFKTDSGLLLLITMVLMAARMGRMFVEDALTALLRVAAASRLAVIQVILLFGLTAAVLSYLPSGSAALLAQAGAYLFFTVAGSAVLIRHLRRLDWESPPYGIGKRRVLGIGLPNVLNDLGLILLRQSSELFFLGIFFSADLVGLYMLGCTAPLMAIGFIPIAMQKLFMVGFAEAYSKDPSCLGRLVSSLFRAMILLLVPLSAFGVFFAPRGIALIYGQEMIEAGPIAAMFSVVHLLPTVWTPLSIAILTKERVMASQPLMVLQIVVNIALDVVLIPKYGMYGGVAAVFLTFLLTLPVSLYVVRRLVGGIYFPMGFFLKVSVPLYLIAAALSPLAPHLNLFTFILLSVAYLTMFFVLIRLLGFLRDEDVAELRDLGFGKLNRVLDFLVKPRRTG